MNFKSEFIYFINNKDKKEYSIFITGEYGIGKSYFVKEFFKNKKDYLNVYTFNIPIDTDISVKNVTEEYNRIMHEIDIYSNIDKYNSEKSSVHNTVKIIIYIDQNDYFNLFNNKLLVKSLVLKHNDIMTQRKKCKKINECFEVLLLFVFNDIENICSDVIDHIFKIEMPIPTLEIKKSIFGIDTNDYDFILNSSNNLNILSNKLKIAKIHKTKGYELNNRVSENIFESKNYRIINNKLIDIITNKENIYDIKYLYELNNGFNKIDNYIQEYFYIPLLESYNNTNKEKQYKIKKYIFKINEMLKLSNKFNTLINYNQDWKLTRYTWLLNACIILYYINHINNISLINTSSVNIKFSTLSNKMLLYKKYKNTNNILNIYYPNNENYHLMIISYILSLFKKYNNKENQDKLYCIVKYYNFEKFNNIGIIKKCFNLQNINNVNKDLIESFIKFLNKQAISSVFKK